MMITLLASIAGFISSIFPELIKYFKDRNDKDHELSIMDRQIKFSKSAKASALEEIKINQENIETTALYATFKTGITWIDALNGTVRPVLAYSFFWMYSLVKYTQYSFIKESSEIIKHIEILWTVDDQAIFAGIISFYFGQRTFSKLWKHKI